ncbi:MAG: hypothetical protein ACKVOK_00310 [Flavobacteriales bacterium]
MRFKHYALIFLVSFAGSVFLASCLNEENRIPPNCYDGILNNEESGGQNNNDQGLYDCGGPFCEPCNHCVNGIIDEGETWIDCGGECGPCPTCGNGILDVEFGETGIDCGPIGCPECSELCNNGVLDGEEEDVDCGGACDACPTCDDLMMNGGEYGIDCGGPCAPCCTVNNCDNNILDPNNEFLEDCGGKICPDCVDTLHWAIDGEHYYCPSQITLIDDGPPDALVVNGGVTDLLFTISDAVDHLGLNSKVEIQLVKPGSEWQFPVTETPANYPISADDVFPVWILQLEYTSPDGFVYALNAANDQGQSEGTFKFLHDDDVVPNSTIDECNKPAGSYFFYYGYYSGTLACNSAGIQPIDVDYLEFKFTFYYP